MRPIDALLVPHAPSLLAPGLRESFAELKDALDEVRRRIDARRPTLALVASTEDVATGPFKLAAAPLYQGNLGGGSVPSTEWAHPGADVELVRSLVRRLRLAGVDAELVERGALDFASAVALRLVLPDGGVPILPIVLPAEAASRSGFRFGSVMAELLAEHAAEPLWISAGALSGQRSKDPDAVPAAGEEFDREILDAFAHGEIDPLLETSPRRISRVGADAGLAHLFPLLGFVGDGYRADVLGYGGIFGGGNAVVAFRSGSRPTGELDAVSSDVVGGDG